MSLLENLETAWKYISTNNKWCQGSYRKISEGQLQHCSLGALTYSNKTEYGAFHWGLAALNATLTRVNRKSDSHLALWNISGYNDRHSYEQVRRLWAVTMENERRGRVEQRNKDRRIRQAVIAMRKAVPGGGTGTIVRESVEEFA